MGDDDRLRIDIADNFPGWRQFNFTAAFHMAADFTGDQDIRRFHISFDFRRFPDPKIFTRFERSRNVPINDNIAGANKVSVDFDRSANDRF